MVEVTAEIGQPGCTRRAAWGATDHPAALGVRRQVLPAYLHQAAVGQAISRRLQVDDAQARHMRFGFVARRPDMGGRTQVRSRVGVSQEGFATLCGSADTVI